MKIAITNLQNINLTYTEAIALLVKLLNYAPVPSKLQNALAEAGFTQGSS